MRRTTFDRNGLRRWAMLFGSSRKNLRSALNRAGKSGDSAAVLAGVGIALPQHVVSEDIDAEDSEVFAQARESDGVIAMSQPFAMRSNEIGMSDIGRLAAAGVVPADVPALSATDASIELLRTISEVLDIRAVFPRVSTIASHVLAHDCLALGFFDERNQLTLEARSTDACPEFRRFALAGDMDRHIVGDLRSMRSTPALCDPPDLIDRLITQGYRSLLVVRSLARNQAIGLIFLSTRTEAFTPRDVRPAASDCRLRRARGLARAARGRRAPARRSASPRGTVRCAGAESRRRSGLVVSPGADGRAVPGMERRSEEGYAGRLDRNDGLSPGRIRDRQRSDRALHPPCLRPTRGTVCRHQLCGPAGAVARIRTVRLRTWRVHRSPATQARPNRDGVGWSPVP